MTHCDEIQPVDAAPALGTSIMIWQFNQGSVPPTVAEIARVCLENGITQIKPKVLDGQDYMGYFDTILDKKKNIRVRHPLSFLAPTHVIERKQEFEAAGMSFVPWVNVRGINIEAERAAILALYNAGCDTIELDVEPYKGFWEHNFWDLYPFVQSLNEAGVKVWVNAHISGYTVRELPLRQMSEHVALWLSQSYWTTFKSSARETIEYEMGVFRDIGALAYGSIFPSAGWQDFPEAIQTLREQGGIHASIWSLNQINRDLLKAFKAAL